MNIEKMVLSKFEEYTRWDCMFSYNGWQNIELFIEDTLSAAWMKARPDDAYKFNDENFANMVNQSNGKWLEKQSPDDSYKIILSTKYGDSVEKLTETFVHEIRHAIDYQAAVKDMDFEEYHVGNRYYINWSEFRAVVCQVRYHVFCILQDNFSDKEIFFTLSEILGTWAADCVQGLLMSSDYEEQLYYISRYIGASRSIRNLNMELDLNAQSLQLWYMTPTFITEKYGNIFYLGNEWDNMDNCSLDELPKSSYYDKLIKCINCNKNS